MSLNLFRQRISDLGYELTPEVLPAVLELLDAEQQQLARRIPPAATDLHYAEHERQVLDIYKPADAGVTPLPVLMFVHGGGFLRGDKGSAERWHNACVGRMAADRGFIGVVMNYRLAPEHTWPAGGEDVGLAVDWLTGNIHRFGGDPDKIVLVGTSAGAVHCATYLRLHPQTAGIRGMVLLSGLYGYTPLDERDRFYYGEQTTYPSRWPKEVLTETNLPLLIACAEFDPPRFQAEFLGIMQARLRARGVLPRSILLSGHNHYSMASHLGTSDTRLADEIVSFVHDSLNKGLQR